VRHQGELLAEVAPVARWRWCRRHWLHGDVCGRGDGLSTNFFDERRRGLNDWWRRTFNRWWRRVAWASAIHAEARGRWLALQTKFLRRSLADTANWAPATARNSICTDATSSGVEEAAERTMASIASVATNTRPKALEDAVTLCMVAVVTDRATTYSTDATEGEEQTTNDVRR